MQDRIRALVVDDDADVRNLLTGVLTRSQMTVVEAASGGEAMTALGRDEFDVVCVDVRLPDHSGLDILRWARGAEIDTEFIVLTGHADVDTAVEAMRLGAYDFVAKPWKNVELLEVVRKAVEKKALRRENVVLREVITRRDGLPEIVGESPEIREVLTIIGRVAASDSPVLVHGESGTGKELVARAIHLRSKRAGRPFVSVNCGALPDTLLETELFGHKKGAFTGAIAARAGLFEAADGGTLFLDEIGEMSPAMQVRLLRTLDSGEVRRVGEERTFHVNVRVVAATNKDLNQEATEGRFRWDLFYRVCTVIVPVPPLRKRRGDIPLLVQHFIGPHVRAGKSLRFSPEAMSRLAGLRVARQHPRAPEPHRAPADPPRGRGGRARDAAARGDARRDRGGRDAGARGRGRHAPLAGGGRAPSRRARPARHRLEQGARGAGARSRHQDPQQEDPRLRHHPARVSNLS